MAKFRSKADIAKALNVSPPHLANIMAGRAAASELLARRMGKYFKTGYKEWMEKRDRRETWKSTVLFEQIRHNLAKE